MCEGPLFGRESRHAEEDGRKMIPVPQFDLVWMIVCMGIGDGGRGSGLGSGWDGLDCGRKSTRYIVL